MSTTNRKSVLFVCLGNTCRSPIAEAIFLRTIKERKIQGEWDVSSAALEDWHRGKPENIRATRVLHHYGITDYEHIARKITQEDFSKFHWILGMDEYNIHRLKKIAPSDFKGSILLVGSFDPQGETIIEDPYCDYDEKGFIKCYEQCVRSCSAFLDKVMEER